MRDFVSGLESGQSHERVPSGGTSVAREAASSPLGSESCLLTPSSSSPDAWEETSRLLHSAESSLKAVSMRSAWTFPTATATASATRDSISAQPSNLHSRKNGVSDVTEWCEDGHMVVSSFIKVASTPALTLSFSSPAAVRHVLACGCAAKSQCMNCE